MKVENVKVYGLENAIRCSKFPMAVNTEDVNSEVTKTVINLGNSDIGSGHGQFLVGIIVQFDLTFTNKAWVELQRYHFIDFISSQSTMHKLSSFDFDGQYNKYVDQRMIDIMEELKDTYNTTKDKEDYLRLLYSNPSGFELTAGMTTNYQQLKTMYFQRKNHRLPEWREFCEWVKTLPMFNELCLGGEQHE